MRRRDPADLVSMARAGNRSALARLISLVEAGGGPADVVASLVWPLGGSSYTVGITGAPGAGKSTLTDRLITEFRRECVELAVLAVDPSSPFTGGAILGDRVRMTDHSEDDGVYIRSLATRGHLGGLSSAVPGALRVLDAAGFSWVLVETVGVGQVEVEVAGATDSTVVVLNPGWGDAVQANKAGIMEIADVFVINKADRPGTAETERDLESMLDIATQPGRWRPPVIRTVAATGEGVTGVISAVEAHRDWQQLNGALTTSREHRIAGELQRLATQMLSVRIGGPEQDQAFSGTLSGVLTRRIDPIAGAKALVEQLVTGNRAEKAPPM